MAIWAYALFGFAAGAMLPFQFCINSQLADWVGSPLRAAFVSFAVGTLALLAVMLAAYRDWPSADRVSAAPWWVWVGGLLGAFYVLGSIVTAPKLGAATLVAVILAGQALASLLVDHYGWVGFEENPSRPAAWPAWRSSRSGSRSCASSEKRVGSRRGPRRAGDRRSHER